MPEIFLKAELSRDFQTFEFNVETENIAMNYNNLSKMIFMEVDCKLPWRDYIKDERVVSDDGIVCNEFSILYGTEMLAYDLEKDEVSYFYSCDPEGDFDGWIKFNEDDDPTTREYHNQEYEFEICHTPEHGSHNFNVLKEIIFSSFFGMSKETFSNLYDYNKANIKRFINDNLLDNDSPFQEHVTRLALTLIDLN